MTSAIGMAKGMNDVQRFDFDVGDDGYVDCSDAGEYVRYCDYVALQQQLAAAREAEQFYRTEAEISRHKIDLLMAEVSQADEENRAFLSTDSIVEIITHNTAEEWTATLQSETASHE